MARGMRLAAPCLACLAAAAPAAQAAGADAAELKRSHQSPARPAARSPPPPPRQSSGAFHGAGAFRARGRRRARALARRVGRGGLAGRRARSVCDARPGRAGRFAPSRLRGAQRGRRRRVERRCAWADADEARRAPRSRLYETRSLTVPLAKLLTGEGAHAWAATARAFGDADAPPEDVGFLFRRKVPQRAWRERSARSGDGGLDALERAFVDGLSPFPFRRFADAYREAPPASFGLDAARRGGDPTLTLSGAKAAPASRATDQSNGSAARISKGRTWADGRGGDAPHLPGALCVPVSLRLLRQRFGAASRPQAGRPHALRGHGGPSPAGDVGRPGFWIQPGDGSGRRRGPRPRRGCGRRRAESHALPDGDPRPAGKGAVSSAPPLPAKIKMRRAAGLVRETVLEPGDALFIPMLHAHAVETASDGANVSANFDGVPSRFPVCEGTAQCTEQFVEDFPSRTRELRRGKDYRRAAPNVPPPSRPARRRTTRPSRRSRGRPSRRPPGICLAAPRSTGPRARAPPRRAPRRPSDPRRAGLRGRLGSRGDAGGARTLPRAPGPPRSLSPRPRRAPRSRRRSLCCSRGGVARRPSCSSQRPRCCTWRGKRAAGAARAHDPGPQLRRADGPPSARRKLEIRRLPTCRSGRGPLYSRRLHRSGGGQLPAFPAPALLDDGADEPLVRAEAALGERARGGLRDVGLWALLPADVVRLAGLWRAQRPTGRA